MRFGMGEGFQFSSPYKWRCSKLFYRLFVYCSWLLIARDNSTGFTIQWGGFSSTVTGNTTISFPRSFSAVRSTSVINLESGTLNDVKGLSNSGFYVGTNGGSGAKKIYSYRFHVIIPPGLRSSGEPELIFPAVRFT